MLCLRKIPGSLWEKAHQVMCFDGYSGVRQLAVTKSVSSASAAKGRDVHLYVHIFGKNIVQVTISTRERAVLVLYKISHVLLSGR